MKSDLIASITKEMSFHSIEDLFAQIGFGKVSPNQVIGRLKPMLGIKEERQPGIVTKVVDRLKKRKGDRGIMVKGVSDMLIRFANCCHPLPGEKVIGFMTRGRGVTVHKEGCRHILNADPDRLVEVTWESTNEELHVARLKVRSIERKGVLADVSAALTQKDANIIQADIKTTTDQKGISVFTIEVKDYRQLQDIIGAVKRVKNILSVERI